ncbi:MAG: hypothetical protein JXA96_13130 [Sedimentisphaerales bacterium]|nr:hypothetical protein [Sedimentisphaerales bacterium]
MKLVPSNVNAEVLRDSGYGSVPGLDDEELLDEAELMRWVYREQWGPLFCVPMQVNQRYPYRPTIEDDGYLDWGAFGTVDFDRLFPFNKHRFMVDVLREDLRIALIMFDLVKERVLEKDRPAVIEYVYSGKDIELIEDWNQYRMAYRFSEVRAIRARIKRSRQKIYRRS